jgi:hypothetical protein
MFIKENNDVYTAKMHVLIIYKGEELLNKDRNFYVYYNRINDHRDFFYDSDNINNIEKTYLLFFNELQNDTFFRQEGKGCSWNIPFPSECYKIEKFWIWDFDSTLIHDRNLDSIFTYGFSTYYCSQLDEILPENEKKILKDQNFYQHCWFVEGIKVGAGTDDDPFANDSLYIPLICCNKRSLYYKEYLLPFTWFNCRMSEYLGFFEKMKKENKN